MSDEVNLVVGQRRQQLESFIEARSGTANSDSHCCSISEVGVVGLSQVFDTLRNHLWLSQQKESEIGECSSLDVIMDI